MSQYWKQQQQQQQKKQLLQLMIGPVFVKGPGASAQVSPCIKAALSTCCLDKVT